jgi:acetyltransferase-like isoleucine patch superfamily enzyme
MDISGLTIEDHGTNNVVSIEDGAVFKVSKIIIKGDNCRIRIGKALSYNNLTLNLKGNGKALCIKPSKKNINGLKWVSIRGNNQTLSIGENLSCGGLEIQMNDGDEHCSIGDNCLLSWGIKMRTSDGHSVVDLATGKAINLPQDIEIEDRVWIGEHVSFLKGSHVSQDSVVGSHAIVTKKFSQPNCVIAGFPAKVLKENVKWDRRMPSEYNRST